MARIAVAGGGPAGATVGRILAGWGFDVTVVSALARPHKAGEVIGPESARLIGKLGLAGLLADARIASPCDGVLSAWPASGVERSEYRAGGELGWSVDRTALDSALQKMAIDCGCRWLTAALDRCTRLPSGTFELTLQGDGNARPLQADFVVDATGRAARLARCLGSRRIVDDRLIAATILLPRKSARPDTFLRITAAADGWCYASDGPCCDTRWTWVSDTASGTGKRALHARLRAVVECNHPAPLNGGARGEVFSMDASSARLDLCTDSGWLAVGDAATAFDPLSGQGLAQALASALAAAHAAREHLAGNRHALAAFAHAVQSTYGHSRRQLDLRYAYQAKREDSAFWRARATRPLLRQALEPTH